jgi:hypothetical protein
MEASIEAGYKTRRGAPDFKRIAKACDLSWRQLYNASRGGNLSMPALELWAKLVHYDLTTPRKHDLF